MRMIPEILINQIRIEGLSSPHVGRMHVYRVVRVCVGNVCPSIRIVY